MNVRCPQCQALYRVDPARVPAAGVRTRCAQCAGVFVVSRRAESAAAAVAGGFPAESSLPAQTVAASTAKAAAPAAGRAAAPAGAAAGSPPTGAAATGPAQSAAPAASGPTQSASAAAPPAGRRGFRSQDPETRARRLARALVSDIVAYHAERRDRSLETGTLRADFRDEILKSWEEYVQQVGQDKARGTPYFRDALNEILAKGKKVF